MAGGSTRGGGGGGASVAGGDASKRGTSAIGDVARMLASNYQDNTPKRLQVLDMFLVFLFLTGVVQFTYCVLVGTFPFNSFLAGFMCALGVFVLTVSLRMQVVEGSKNWGVVGGRSFERCFAEYVVCNMVLFLVVFNFMG